MNSLSEFLMETEIDTDNDDAPSEELGMIEKKLTLADGNHILHECDPMYLDANLNSQLLVPLGGENGASCMDPRLVEKGNDENSDTIEYSGSLKNNNNVVESSLLMFCPDLCEANTNAPCGNYYRDLIYLKNGDKQEHKSCLVYKFFTSEAPQIHLKLSTEFQHCLEDCVLIDDVDAMGKNKKSLAGFNPQKIEEIDVKQDPRELDLKMDQYTGTVSELYEQLVTVSLPKIYGIQKKFGKGQISRIPKIRTFQRRRALVAEINKFSVVYNRSVIDSLKFFEKYRLDKKRTVAWLYNNIDQLQEFFYVKSKI